MLQSIDYGVKVSYDNYSDIRLVENSVFHARTKYVVVHNHFVREKVLRGEIQLEQVKANDQVDNIFIKDFGGPKFEKFGTKGGKVSPLSPLPY